jgi:valyl-tRNA synthetase
VELAPQYDPKTVEKRLYDRWTELGIFTARNGAAQPKYTIILPPPNVTGVLHMGHALTVTLEDILIRRKRMQGHNALWVPGTDHAGIATQMVVERNLMKERKISRHDLGREKFLEEVWKWKEQSQGTILGQLRLMGCSLDWTRLHFTLDDSVSRAVRECFVRLHRDGLVYRDEAIIQWCPRCRTALSDLEVKFQQTKGKLWHIRYRLKTDSKRWLVVATTRPETLLGDLAVAVHPDDERFTAFHGKQVLVPLVDREIPVITDTYVDRAFGTGALKITPGHDPNDYLIGKKHKLGVLSIFDDRAHTNAVAGPYQGLSREKAREKVLQDLQTAGLLEKEEDHSHNVGHCDRCGTVVEPRVSAQWFVNAAELARDAIRVVESKEIRIVPEEWEKTYFEWMRNIRPWCISRQLWWGHRIPVWYCGDCPHQTVAVVEPKACEKCGSARLRQEEDVLDTWFSSGLWPISTLGWPEASADLRDFYPTDVMETGFDILFFWVARMIMLCMRMTGKIPFHTVYLHPMVRDEYGQKMSKTKGNVKDPLEIIERVGADSLRFTLASLSVHGRDVLLSDARIEGYRNFVNKIWNASRFVLMHFGAVQGTHSDPDNEINRWISARLNATKRAVNAALDQYRFFDAASLLYHFVWNDYCDWFLEFIKHPEELEARKAKGDATALLILDEALRLLHPLMPFVTEEVWQKLPLPKNTPSISLAAYPQATGSESEDERAQRKLNWLIAVVEAVRSKRGEAGLAPAAEIHVAIGASPAVTAELQPMAAAIQRLTRAKALRFGGAVAGEAPAVLIPIHVGTESVEIRIPREELIDVETERVKAKRELEAAQGELQRARQKLASEEFTAKAPPQVVDGVRERSEVLQKKVQTLVSYLKSLE